MRNLKKILALALALVMTLSLVTVANATFTDNQNINGTYQEAVDVLNGMGVFQGYTDGSFAPKGEITRAEVAAIIYRIVTGDVKDTQAKIYSDYVKFDDVNPNSWYAGYIGYCANAEYIKGYGNGKFGPNDKVTGYQALAMILRAMGYDQNGEFTGTGWEIRVASTAQQRNILVNVAEGTLGIAATRELVAEILFQAIQKSTVVYTPALGYYTANLAGMAVATTSLGYKTFGLTKATGIVVGNQATGETYTKIAFTGDATQGLDVPSYTYTDATNFNTSTGLDLFGHAVKVWYNNKDAVAKTVYASYDKATKAATVYASDADLASTAATGLKNAVVNAGFSYLSSAAHYSNAYQQLTAATQSNSIAGTHPCGLYVVVSNNAYLTTDAVIRIDAEVAQIGKIDTTAYNKTLTLTSSTYGSTGTIPMASLTAGSVTTLGSVVIAQKVNGTAAANTKLPYYDLSAVTTTTGTVVARDATTGKVVLSDGSVIEKSPLANAVKSGVSMPGTWNNATYRFTLDKDGKYIGATLVNDQSFIYGTFADYASAGLSTGTVNYYLTGVTLDGQIVTKDITKALGTSTPSSVYSGLTVTKKDWANNIITTSGTHTGYAIDSNGLLTTNTAAIDVLKMNYDWTITKANVAAGFVSNATADTFFTNATKFIVVSGTGTDTLSVKTYNGIAELLGAADSVTLDAYVAAAGDGNIYYTVSNYIYNNVVGQTKHVDTVILGADDLDYVTTSNVYYCHTQVAGLTTTGTVGGTLTSATQYTLYQDGVAAPYYITGTAPVADTFYVLTEAGTTVSGDPIYTVASTTTGTISGTYSYVGATNNLDTAVINSTLKTVTGATVVNLTPPALGYALGSIAELNNAVSVGYTVTVDCVTNAAGVVTVIYVTGPTA